MYYIVTKNDTNYLMHHGIKGQKWGVRRYQNEDGSLTGLGRKRYGRYQNMIDAANSERDEAIKTLQKNHERYTTRKQIKLDRLQNKIDNTSSDNKKRIERLGHKIDKVQNSLNKEENEYKDNIKTIKRGYKKYTSIIETYGKNKIKSLDNKMYKKTDEFIKSRKAYNDLSMDLYISGINHYALYGTLGNPIHSTALKYGKN